MLQTHRKIFFSARKKQAAQSLFKTPKNLTFTHCVKRNWKQKKAHQRGKQKYNPHDYNETFCLFTRCARLFASKRSSKWLYDIIMRVLQSQLGAIYARARSMFHLFILEFNFCCCLSFIYFCIELAIIWYKRSWFWFLSLFIAHAFHVNNICNLPTRLFASRST